MKIGGSICLPCYYYSGECFLECPKSTKLNEEEKTCENIEIEHLSSFTKMIYIMGLSSIAAYFVLGACVKIMVKGKKPKAKTDNKPH